MSITFKNLGTSIYFCKENDSLLKHFFLLTAVLLFLCEPLSAQNADSTGIADTGLAKIDSLRVTALPDTVFQVQTARPVFKLQNKFLNNKGTPVSLSVEFRRVKNNDSLFYLISGIVLLLASLKYFYSRYFTNLFRVFFNTSLRQSQLTDQLLQAKLPSLLFNAFFIISGGMYSYILLSHYQLIHEENRWLMMTGSTVVIGVIYFLKFCTLKFTGWVTGLKEITNTYIFIIFLINKIMGIFLVPFIIIMIFSQSPLVKVGMTISLMSIGLLMVLRFFRSYGLLQNQLKVSWFHFSLYIVGIEILPLLLIYKGLMLYLSKNL